MLAVIRRCLGLDGILRSIHITLSAMASDNIRPAILGPFHFLDGSLSAKRTAKLRAEWSGAKMYQIYLSKLRLHIASMTGFLQYHIRVEILWL